MNTWYWLIPSQNIREHLQKIEYKFSALEVAFLLWNNKNITISQKHGYWNTLTKEMPDEEIKRRINTDPYPSLHDYLRAYKETQNALLAEFYDEKNAVYSYRFYCEGDNGWCENYKTVYPTYNAAYSALKEDFDLPIVKVEIKKQRLDEPKRIITVMMTKDEKPTDIDVLGATKQESDILYGVFEGLWLDIPLPFKRGDILQAKRSYYDCETEDSKPFVLESCHNWSAKEYKENGVLLSRERARNIDWSVYRHRKNGDISDTFPCGYALSDGFVRGANKLYRHVLDGTDFLSLEYYKGELTGANRLLSLLSKRMKNEIDDEVFAHGHFIITQEEYLKEYKKYMDFRSDIWEEFGIKVKKIKKAGI